MTSPAVENASLSLRRIDLARVLSALRRLALGNGSAPWLHGEVARRMAERLALIRLQPSALLDWWGCAGAGGPLLTQIYPAALRTVVEPTPALQALSRDAARLPWWSPRRLQQPAAATVIGPDAVAPDSVQLVWANMMLHGVADPPRLFALWHRALQVDGFVMFSCLGPDTCRELRDLYQRLGWPPPMADFVDMHDLGDMLVRAGFADPVMDQETLHLSWPDATALLAELRGLGGNASPDRHAGCRTPRWHARLLRELNSLKGADGRLHLRFEVAYGHAFKVAPKAVSRPETTVSLEEMRALVRKRDDRD